MADSTRHPATPGPPKAFLAAIEKLLRPLVRLLLSQQITFPLLSSMLKGIYIDVAEKELQVPGKRQSDSRINLLTGVHRKDVKRLRSETKSPSTVPVNISVGAKIIGYWLGSPRYLDNSGNPRPLPLKAATSHDASFDELVEKVCRQDIRPRVILDEWLRLGVAHIDSNGNVVLNSGAFTPDQGYDEKLFFFGKNIHDHISAGTHNLLGQKPSHFDRSVYYDGLTRESISVLTNLANSLGMKALTDMNREALKRQDKDKDQSRAHYRMNFGIFNFNAESDSARSDPVDE
ncbi:MAG: DUF6502 family protein [Pseudohongiellaceae bacterium]